MSWRAGTYGLEHIGVPTLPPTLTCDGCGMRLVVRPGVAPMWMLNRKAPKGWRMVSSPDGCLRHDYRPQCKGTAPREWV